MTFTTLVIKLVSWVYAIFHVFLCS